MTTESLTAEIARRAMLLASDLPDFALDKAVRQIVSTLATTQLGDAPDDEIGEVDSVVLDAKAGLAAMHAADMMGAISRPRASANRGQGIPPGFEESAEL